MLGNIKERIKSYLEPTEQVPSIYDIDLHGLKLFGIKGLILDLDDTILPKNEYKISLSLYSWIEKIKDTGFKIYIASNGGRSARLKYILGELNLKGNAFSFKPLPFIFYHALSNMKLKPSETAVIGDQLITDTLGGNLLRMYTILVKPLSKELSFTRVIMKIAEDFLMKIFKI